MWNQATPSFLCSQKRNSDGKKVAAFLWREGLGGGRGLGFRMDNFVGVGGCSLICVVVVFERP